LTILLNTTAKKIIKPIDKDEVKSKKRTPVSKNIIKDRP